MSRYIIKRINDDNDIHLLIKPHNGRNYGNVTINHKEQIATIYWSSVNGIYQNEYFTRTLRVPNNRIVSILKNRLYNQFIEDGFWNQINKELYTNISKRYYKIKINQKLNEYFKQLDGWYEEI